MKLFKSLALAAIASATIESSAFAVAFNEAELSQIIDRAQELKAQGKSSVVLFDLDDTLVSTQERSLRILREFASQPEIQRVFPESSRLFLLKETDIQYELALTFKNIGIANKDLLKAASTFWMQRFFTNAYCSKDKALAGAKIYLHRLIAAGAKVVYLTGRDAPGMELGTRANLVRNNFPHHPSQALLMMKPDKSIDDLIFKTQAFTQVAEMGEVIGVFENEPANLNAMAKAFPQAKAMFVDTIHSPKPDRPVEGAIWIKNYQSQSTNQRKMCSGVF